MSQAVLHPLLEKWIREKFGTLTPAQAETIPHVIRGQSVLLSSPTGTGKTLAAFLGIFDHLFKKNNNAKTPLSGLTALYISPLRALAYDIQKNLNEPLEELGGHFIRVAMRTGDTPAKERAAIKKRPPSILVTTPESLCLMLGQRGYQEIFSSVQFVVIDELHSIAENKRGTQLMLALEVLEELIAGSGPSRSLCRIGLSATVTPLPLMANYLTGGRPCAMVSREPTKKALIEVFSPIRKHPYPASGYTTSRVLKELAGVIQQKRTTLIFSNMRSGAESIGLQIKQELPQLADQIAVHHASLDRSIRQEVEDRLKNGELRAVVCSTTLELGIDIGSIDLVIMVSAPKGVARALQRIGRSGHSIHQSSHGLLIATNINDLVECSVTARLMERRELEPLRISENSLDVLAQHLIGLALRESYTLDQIYAITLRAFPYRTLSRRQFDRVVRYLQGGGVRLEEGYTEIFGKIRITPDGIVRPFSPKISRQYFQNVGTIASETMIRVKRGGRTLGQVEESFMKRLNPGDIFVLNGEPLQLIQTRQLEAVVKSSRGRAPTVPRWNASKMPLASGLAREVIRLRTKMAGYFDPLPLSQEAGAQVISEATTWIVDEYGISASNAEAVARQMQAQALVSRIPTNAAFLIEVFAEGKLRHYFFHSLIGRTANDALSRIAAWRLKEVKPGNALVTVDDYGFLLSLREDQELTLDEARRLFAPQGAEQALVEALKDSGLVKWQFRGVAQNGMMVPRRVSGEERRPKALQWSAEVIYEVLRQYEPDHVLLEEAFSEAMHRFLDLPHALAFLEEVHALPWQMIPVDRVSPFAFGIFVSKIRETMMMEDVETAVERLYHEMYQSLGVEGGTSGSFK